MCSISISRSTTFRSDSADQAVMRCRRPPDSVMTDDRERDEWQTQKVMDWLFLLLRFAVTRDERDRTAACAAAQEIDSLGARSRPADCGFFLRTSDDVCKAVVEPDDPQRLVILKRHAQRIDHPRLRNCFRAAVDLEEIAQASGGRSSKRVQARASLWKGLRGSCLADHPRK